MSYTVSHENKMDSLTTLTIRLPKALKIKLEERATSEDLTVSQLVRRHFSTLPATTRVAPAPVPGAPTSRRRKTSTKRAA